MLSWLSERQEFIAICKRAFRLGLQVSTGGNISIRLDPETFLVKPSGLSLYDLKEDDLLIVDPSGHVVEGQGKPTKEMGFHLAIYGVREDVGAIIHYHPPYATSFAVLGKEIPLQTVQARRILKRVPIISAAKEGSDDLAQWLCDTFTEGEIHAALLTGHGIVSVGEGIKQAQNIAELIEETAKIAVISSLISGR